MKKTIMLLTAGLLASMSYAAGMNRTAGVADEVAKKKAPSVVETVPYEENFSEKEKFGNFLVVDNNQDGKTWTYNVYDECARYDYHATNDADDWLLTPKIRLEKGKIYHFSFNYRRGYSSGEKIGVAFGLGDNPDQYETIAEPFEVMETSMTNYSSEVTVSETGDYRFGIHAVSPANLFYICIDDISVTAGAETSAPDAVTNLVITPGEKGALAAHISFNAPTQTIEGGEIASLSKIDVLCDNALIKTISSPAVGSELSFDASFEASGMKAFTVIAYMGETAGRPLEQNSYIGIDSPLPPAAIRLIDNGMTLTVEWDAAGETGVNGGYVDVEQLTYNVYDYSEKKIGEGIDELSFLDDDYNPEGNISPIQYYVTAKNEIGESSFGNSPYFAIGPVLELPLSESFAGGYQEGKMKWWLDAYFEYPVWWTTSQLSFDGDGGCAILTGGTGERYFNTGKISLKDEPSPYLIFSYYAYPETNNKLEVIGSKMQKEEVKLWDVDYSTMEGEEGWKRVYLPLSSVKDCHYTVLRFHGTCMDEEHQPAIDGIEVKNLLGNDLSAFIEAPSVGVIGKDCTIKVNVANDAINNASGFNVSLFCNDKLVETKQGNNMTQGQYDTYTFNFAPNATAGKQITLYAVVDYSADEDMTNNTTANALMNIVSNTSLPVVTDLSHSDINGQPVLTWSEPEQPDTVTESFEGFDAWQTEYLGWWTLADLDKGFTFNINGVEHPNSGAQMAYIVYNPASTGIDLIENPMIASRTGEQFLGCYGSDPETMSLGHNDDWIISPLLNGEAQTVKLWAKSLFAEYKEKIEILYSLTDTNIESFVPVVQEDSVTNVWTEFDANLPAGAKYFALRCLSQDKLLLMVDDITFAPAKLTVKGYRVYCGDKLVGEVDGNTTTFTAMENGDYHVTVVYDEGESELSNVDTVTTGITDVGTRDYSVEAKDGTIVLNNAEGKLVSIYSVNGAKIYSAVATNHLSINVASGIYIVKVGGQTIRVAVK